MNLAKGLLGGIIGAAVGAAAWTALMYFTGWEHGLLAWGVGFLVGFAMVVVGGGVGGTTAGVIAVVLTVASICGGKAGAIVIVIGEQLAQFNMPVTPNDMVLGYADDEALSRENAGETLNWPDGMDYENAYEAEDYPPEIMTEAAEWWAALSPEEQSAEMEQYDMQVTPDNVMLWHADEVALNRENAGETLNWPDGMDYEKAYEAEDYPPEIMTEAAEWWAAFTPQEQSAELARTQQEIDDGQAAWASAVFVDAFKASFGLLDILFFLFAVATAFGIAAGHGDGETAAAQ